MTRSKAKYIRLLAEMKSIHNAPKLKVYGSPRMTSELHDRGLKCSEKTVATLMQQHGLFAKGAKAFKQPKTTTVDKSAEST